ncbi:hypothetical protein [Nostoc sp.]
MPARGFLTQGQQESLQQAVRESADKHLREQALMLLLMNDGLYARILLPGTLINSLSEFHLICKPTSN